MKRYTATFGLLVLLFAASLTLVSCGGAGAGSEEQGSGDQGSEEPAEDMQGTEDRGGTSGSQTMGYFDEEEPFDLQFIDQMIVHHQGAIMSSEDMITDSERLELRQLAENIQKSQSEQIEQMRAWREQWYPDAEPTFEMMDSAQMEEMMGEGHTQQEMMDGDATDRMFLRMMIPHHQSAIDMSEQALERAEHPELRELAQKIIDEQTAELGLMEGYLEEIDAPAPAHQEEEEGVAVAMVDCMVSGPCIGTSGNDTITGSDEQNEIYGLEGDDTIDPGNDFVRDYVYCGPGFDTVHQQDPQSASESDEIAEDCEERAL